MRGNSATAMDADGDCDESSENEETETETERQHGPHSTLGGKSKKRRRHRPKRQKAKVLVRRLARRRSVRTMSAPMVTTLFPFEGNVHEFVAGPQGAAVLDHDRDCNFYIPEIGTVHEVPVGNSTNDGGASNNNTNNSSETRVWLRKVPQPDDFQCVNGSYGILGTDDS
jgi:hypothetical protein